MRPKQEALISETDWPYNLVMANGVSPDLAREITRKFHNGTLQPNYRNAKVNHLVRILKNHPNYKGGTSCTQ